MLLSSLDFSQNGVIPSRFTCEGDNINPTLVIDDVPKRTKSLTLIVEDPDASAKPGVHWLVFNIPANTQIIEKNSIPEGGTEGFTNGHAFGYEGPCPTGGIHRYEFKLYAVAKILAIPKTSNRNNVLKAMKGTIIEQTTLSAVYQKNYPYAGASSLAGS